jgi:hypothetical protein
MKCKECELEKDISEFYKKGHYKGIQRYSLLCKGCHKNKYLVGNEEARKEYAIRYRSMNNEKYKETRAKYRVKNKEKILEYTRRNSNAIKARTNEWRRNRIENDDLYKRSQAIRKAVSSGFRRMLKNKESRSIDILGCSNEFFISYIESKFTEGMSWDNYGYYGWHLDHIKPISLAIDYDDIVKLSHYTNFQPLWRKDNLDKSNKYLIESSNDSV